MYLTVLGNNGPFPAPDGACSSYLLESDSGETTLLLDAGTGSLARLLQHVRVEALTGVAISHLHFDHMSDLLPCSTRCSSPGADGLCRCSSPGTPSACATCWSARITICLTMQTSPWAKCA